jgi:hypothetical protein
MEKQVRNLKVWVCLIATMTAGAFVLTMLDRNALSAGAFSLSSYVEHQPKEQKTQNQIPISLLVTKDSLQQNEKKNN